MEISRVLVAVSSINFLFSSTIFLTFAGVVVLRNDVVQVLHKYSTRQLRIYQRYVPDSRDSLLNGYCFSNGFCKGHSHINVFPVGLSNSPVSEIVTRL